MAGTRDRLKAWFFFLNPAYLKRPVFWLSFLGLIFIVGLMLGIPYYITSQNQYCSTCHAMESYYKTWQNSTHANTNCLACHVEPGWKSGAYHFVRTTREIYTNLVGSTGERSPFYSAPSNALCFTCHTQARDVSASGDLIIPHTKHVNMRGLKCIDCHKYLVHFKNPEGKNTPSMTICYKCHDGKKASKECRACHTKKSFPETHKSPDFLSGHGALAQTEGKTCAKCHAWTPGYCTECHLKRPASHAGIEFRTYHKERAQTRQQGCYVCHGKAFCKNCHD